MATGSTQVKTTVVKESRVEALRQKLGYPIKQHDPQGSDFWYLRPGEDAAEAEETCPIAVGFYPELNEATDERSLQRLLTSPEWQRRIYGHYLNRTSEQQPVMYVLLPTEEGVGRVPLVLPTEGGLRQRNIQTFAWDSAELETRLNRLRQGDLPIAAKALISIPLVERAFYQPIKTAKELAQLLAEAARRIEQIIPKVYQSEEHRYPGSKGAEGYLHKLLKSFQQELLPTLQLSSENEKDYSFADIYAQTIAYSLFTARVFGYVRDQREGRKKEELFDRESAWQQLPETNPFLRRLFQDVSEQSPEALGDELIGAIADIFAILRAAKMDVILQDFRQKRNREDIVIRFYEDFLAAYKPGMRERRGVYYTPEPVVSYMVRSVDMLLKEKFNKPLGLADPEVMILDPACGTGTFLLKICQMIHDRFHVEREAIVSKVGDISWSDYVSDHLLPRIFGFELLMAPYAIAHLKLGLFLEETGYKFNCCKRLEIYLVNALDDNASGRKTLFGQFLTEESEQANKVKTDREVMVVIGNPPYSNQSQNLSKNARQWVDAYREVDGEIIRERGALQFEKNIQDDYIKFFRFAQRRIDETGYGILSFISNHSYLDAPTLRGMRHSLTQTFDDIYVLNIHGNAKRGERCPDGSKDENVFDIQQGVSVGILIKEPSSSQSRDKNFKYSDVWGLRDPKNKLGKYSWLSKNCIDTTQWVDFLPIAPFHLFKPQDNVLFLEYEKGCKITDAFPINSSGIITARDALTIWFTKDDLWKTIEDFAKLPVESAREKYSLGKDTNDWKIELAQKDILKRCSLSKEFIKKISYRPFDMRYTYYTGNARGFHCNPRRPVMKHMLAPENIGFHLCRQLSTENWAHILVTDLITDDSYVSNKTRERGYTFPLYIHPDSSNIQELEHAVYPNFSHDFVNRVNSTLGYTPTPEVIFYYIYAIFHSPTYRSRYAEFLKIDFPRVPLTRNDDLFRQLAAYGEELVALHLMKSAKLEQKSQLPPFVEQGGKCVVEPAHPKYEAKTRSVTINKKGDRFIGVPEAVWNFYVGGYPVCAKWLKDRKGRTLTQADITHYQRIVVALQETMRLMQQIDEAIPGFPIV